MRKSRLEFSWCPRRRTIPDHDKALANETNDTAIRFERNLYLNSNDNKFKNKTFNFKQNSYFGM